MAQYAHEAAGENIEFTASSIGDYTIWFNADGTSSEFEKFADNPVRGRKFALRMDKSGKIVSMNGISFTDPITVTANNNHVEERNVPTIFKMVVRTESTNIVVRIRWI